MTQKFTREWISFHVKPNVIATGEASAMSCETTSIWVKHLDFLRSSQAVPDGRLLVEKNVNPPPLPAQTADIQI